MPPPKKIFMIGLVAAIGLTLKYSIYKNGDMLTIQEILKSVHTK